PPTLTKMNEPKESTFVFRDTLQQMSHEVRTPLTSIIGFSELLLEDESFDPRSRENLKIISDEAKRLAEMLNHYISVLHVESGT
ncbi:MAG: histidine kinase dimerization/phospho-acceptor domain-containing protein, partial [Acidobacteriota bacterium]